MKKYILALSDAYSEENFVSGEQVCLKDIEGTNCYCSEESAGLLRERLAGIPLEALHWIDTGDYHYLTLFFLERITEPFDLVLIDNHPDDQPSAFGECGIISCGDWMRHARQLKNFRDGDDYPVYLSIDLDFLHPDVFKTDWNQGSATLDDLSHIIRERIHGRRVIGIDVCGGLTRSKGATDADLLLNKEIRERLIGLLPEIN